MISPESAARQTNHKRPSTGAETISGAGSAHPRAADRFLRADGGRHKIGGR
jgi:hypothetical protein